MVVQQQLDGLCIARVHAKTHAFGIRARAQGVRVARQQAAMFGGRKCHGAIVAQASIHRIASAQVWVRLDFGHGH